MHCLDPAFNLTSCVAIRMQLAFVLVFWFVFLLVCRLHYVNPISYPPSSSIELRQQMLLLLLLDPIGAARSTEFSHWYFHCLSSMTSAEKPICTFFDFQWIFNWEKLFENKRIEWFSRNRFFSLLMFIWHLSSSLSFVILRLSKNN